MLELWNTAFPRRRELAGFTRTLRHAARSCIGLDILEADVGALVERGYDVRVHDLTSKPFDGHFNLVVAGEIIEHLGNPEDFLRNAAAALLPGGRLVVTTPNPYQVHRAVKFFEGNSQIPSTMSRRSPLPTWRSWRAGLDFRSMYGEA